MKKVCSMFLLFIVIAVNGFCSDDVKMKGILYCADNMENSDVYFSSGNEQGINLTKTDDIFERSPVIAGEKIYFISDSGPTSSDVCVMNKDGSGKKKLKLGQKFDYIDSIDLSADSKILLISAGTPRETSLFTADADGSNLKKILGDGSTVSNVKLMPDGKTAVCGIAKKVDSDWWVSYIASVSLADGKITVLTKKDGQCRMPAVSADGKKIVFFELAGGTVISIMNSDGSGKKKIGKAEGVFFPCPSFSPDGKKVVYCSRNKSGKAALYQISTDGGNSAEMFAFDDENYELQDISWK